MLNVELKFKTYNLSFRIVFPLVLILALIRFVLVFFGLHLEPDSVQHHELLNLPGSWFGLDTHIFSPAADLLMCQRGGTEPAPSCPGQLLKPVPDMLYGRVQLRFIFQHRRFATGLFPHSLQMLARAEAVFAGGVKAKAPLGSLGDLFD